MKLFDIFSREHRYGLWSYRLVETLWWKTIGSGFWVQCYGCITKCYVQGEFYRQRGWSKNAWIWTTTTAEEVYTHAPHALARKKVRRTRIIHWEERKREMGEKGREREKVSERGRESVRGVPKEFLVHGRFTFIPFFFLFFFSSWGSRNRNDRSHRNESASWKESRNKERDSNLWTLLSKKNEASQLKMFGGKKPADFEVGTSLAFQLFATGDSKQLRALVKRAKVRHCRDVLKVGLLIC